MNVFEKYESEVRGYCRTFPKEFVKSKGSIITDIDGCDYIDFFSGAGALNYGHNNDYIKKKLVDYLMSDGVIHSLDMYTTPKREFLEFFEEKVLIPKNLNYKVQFTGPTGTNAIEAALKLARKVKGRSNIFSFMGCFHGMTLGSIALTSDRESRKGAFVSLDNVTQIPAPYMFPNMDVINYLDVILSDDHSGIDKPAAIVMETVQAEGGVYVFDSEFLQGIRDICNKYDILFIVDDIQVGSCRTGEFFSFERANVKPDIVVISKSIGGYGMPMALTLMKPELDIWKPGEHNGTFRGNQLSIVAAKAGLEVMINEKVSEQVKYKEKIVRKFLSENILDISSDIEIRGIGLIWGIDVHSEELARSIVNECFNNGLILERAGRENSVVKIMPPLVIEEELLLDGLNVLNNSIRKVMNDKKLEMK